MGTGQPDARAQPLQLSREVGRIWSLGTSCVNKAKPREKEQRWGPAPPSGTSHINNWLPGTRLLLREEGTGGQKVTPRRLYLRTILPCLTL